MTTDHAPDEDERQIFTFLDWHLDIAKALTIIAATPDRPQCVVDVKHTARALCLEMSSGEYQAAGKVPIMRGEVDEEYARTVDLSVPVIMADLSRRQGDAPLWMLVDGTHRMRRAYVDGLETLPGYVLDRAEVRRIRVR